MNKKALIVLLIPVFLGIYWFHPVISKTFVWWYTKDDNNQYHEVFLGEHQTIRIDVENHLPFKWTYAVYLHLELIDGNIKQYPNFLTGDSLYCLEYETDSGSCKHQNSNFRLYNPNREVSEKFDNLIGNYRKTKYPIYFNIKGYKVSRSGEKKVLFYSNGLSNSDTHSTTSAGSDSERNLALQTKLDFIDLPRGKYVFEIQGLSQKVPYFDEIKASIKIEPYTAIH